MVVTRGGDMWCHMVVTLVSRGSDTWWWWHVVVTHGGVIKLLSCLAQQQSLDDLLKMPAELGQLHSFSLTHQPAQFAFERVE